MISSSAHQYNSHPYKPKNKWFNLKCHWARTKCFKYLKKFRETELLQDKEAYLRAKTKYNHICRAAKQAYHEKLCNKINRINNSKDWWSLVNEINNHDFKIGNTLTPTKFSDYFSSLLNSEYSPYEFQYAPAMIQNEMLDADITVIDIKVMLSKVKLNKAPGEDRISYEFYINATDEYLTMLANVYTNLYKASQIDESFTKTIIFPIHKKGKVNEANNYRAISFMNTAAKIFMGILNDRLVEWVEDRKIMEEFQAGFRKNYSTADNIYNLASIVSIKLEEKKKVYAFFVDFRAAFDKVSRNALMYRTSL